MAEHQLLITGCSSGVLVPSVEGERCGALMVVILDFVSSTSKRGLMRRGWWHAPHVQPVDIHFVTDSLTEDWPGFN